jgi:hypothetical protein
MVSEDRSPYNQHKELLAKDNKIEKRTQHLKVLQTFFLHNFFSMRRKIYFKTKKHYALNFDSKFNYGQIMASHNYIEIYIKCFFFLIPSTSWPNINFWDNCYLSFLFLRFGTLRLSVSM